jgi:DNA-binding MarR family transcriptional regulator
LPEFLDLHSSTNKAIRNLADAAMRRQGLHLGQDHLLAVLWKRDGMTPGEIAASTNVSTPTVVKMATRLTTAGLLTRRRDDRDSRLVRLWLTAAGRELQGPVEAEREQLEHDLLIDVSPSELAQLLTALAKIQTAANARGSGSTNG